MNVAERTKQERKMSFHDTRQAIITTSRAAYSCYCPAWVETTLRQLMVIFRPVAEQVVRKQRWGQVDAETVYRLTYHCTYLFDQLKKQGVTTVTIPAHSYEKLLQQKPVEERINQFLLLLKNVHCQSPRSSEQAFVVH